MGGVDKEGREPSPAGRCWDSVNLGGTRVSVVEKVAVSDELFPHWAFSGKAIVDGTVLRLGNSSLGELRWLATTPGSAHPR